MGILLFTHAHRCIWHLSVQLSTNPKPMLSVWLLFLYQRSIVGVFHSKLQFWHSYHGVCVFQPIQTLDDIQTTIKVLILLTMRRPCNCGLPPLSISAVFGKPFSSLKVHSLIRQEEERIFHPESLLQVLWELRLIHLWNQKNIHSRSIIAGPGKHWRRLFIHPI